MPVVIPSPPAVPAVPIRDLTIGRLGLPTIDDPITELLGSAVSSVGDATAVGERKMKGFTLTWIVAGFNEANAVAAGNRMRRQLRSLMQNHAYRLAGLYMKFAPDVERNGWLVIGEGELQDSDGGVTFGSYKLSLSQAFLVATLRTHREGFRCDVVDRRLSSTPRDYLGERVFSTDFAALPNLPLFILPPGVTDAAVLEAAVTASALPAGRDGGACLVAPGRSNGDVVSWDRGESNFNTGDVMVYDRRGVLTAPGAGPDAAWEESYGPDYQWNWLTGGQPADSPVLDNGLVRVRWDQSAGQPGFRVDVWNGAAYVEQGKMIFYRVTPGVFADTWVSASLTEYTPDRAVMQCILRSSGDPASHERVYITVCRGGLGATFECYPAPTAAGAQADVALIWQPPPGDVNDSAFKSDTQTLPNPAASGVINASAGSGSPAFSTGNLGAGSFAGSENMVALLRCPASSATVGAYQVTFSVLQGSNAKAFLTTASDAYASSGPEVQIVSQNAAGYGHAHVAFTPTTADQVNEAETIRNASGTTSQVADVTASGGQCVKDTQTAETNATLLKTPSSLLQAKYRVFARVKVDSPATGSFRAQLGAVLGAIVATTTSTTWVWVDLGDVLATSPLAAERVNAWRSAGASGAVYIDRVECFLVEDRTRAGAQYGGSRDLAQARLAACVPQLRRPARAPL